MPGANGFGGFAGEVGWGRCVVVEVVEGFDDLIWMPLLEGAELRRHACHPGFGLLELFGELVLFVLEVLDLLPLALPGVVGGQAVALHALDAALLLLILRLGTLTRGEVGLWLREYLPPGLPLLDGLLLCGGRCRLCCAGPRRRRVAGGDVEVLHLDGRRRVLRGRRRHVVGRHHGWGREGLGEQMVVVD